MLVVFEATVVKSRMRNTDEMRSLANPASRCTVLRHGKWTAISSEALLPGDLISISRSPPVHGEPVTTLLPADLLLLHGTAVVNESALTVSHAALQPRTSRPQAGLLLTRLSLALGRASRPRSARRRSTAWGCGLTSASP